MIVKSEQWTLRTVQIIAEIVRLNCHHRNNLCFVQISKFKISIIA